MTELEKLTLAIENMLNELNTASSVNREKTKIPNKIIFSSKKGKIKRDLWVSSEPGHLFSLLWGYNTNDDPIERGLEGRRYGDFNFTLKVFRYWLIDWQDYEGIPYYDDV